MIDPAGHASSTNLIMPFTWAEAWAVDVGVICLALAAFLRRPTWARWALLALAVGLIVGALR
jgi:hypothetical protein